MRRIFSVIALLSVGSLALAEPDFQVTGTPIPVTLLRQNYGSTPKGISALDLSICNVSAAKQPLVSSEVYQALAGQVTGFSPIGREIMLASILRNQNHSLANVLSILLNSTTGVLSVLSVSKYPMSPQLWTGISLGSLTGQQLLSSLRPILTADQVEKFEAQVLEPALVMDGGSCVERTVFVIVDPNSLGKARAKAPANPISFHIH